MKRWWLTYKNKVVLTMIIKLLAMYRSSSSPTPIDDWMANNETDERVFNQVDKILRRHKGA